MSQQPEDPGHESVNRESHPNASGPDGLAGEMGVSSERPGPVEGEGGLDERDAGSVEGMGSRASAQGTTDGESATVLDRPDDPEPEDTPQIEGQEAPDKPDETSPVTNVDKTVGEVQPDPVANKHQFDPSKNPRH